MDRNCGLLKRGFLLWRKRHHRHYSIESLNPGLRKGDWISVIGLEVHAQIASKTKLFSSGSSPTLLSPVNSCVALFDASLPGTLPVLNSRCVEAGIMTALALGCTVNLTSTFDRKHYFYADLPLGYQITQSRLPLAANGSMPYWVTHSSIKPYKTSASIIQLQLENDSGKSIHDDQDNQSLIDLNRCGVGLMEIVFAPCLSTGEEAVALVKELSSILTKVGSCSCKMEEGALRVDANISVHRQGQELGTRTEVKNLNSTRALHHAIEYEVERQIQILESGEKVMNETLAFDSENRKTVSMRDKESKLDYRFMPEPNLLPLKLKDSFLDGNETIEEEILDVDYFRQNLPALPEDLRKELIEVHGINISIANFVVNEPVIYDLYIRSLEHGVDNVKTLITFLTTTVQEVLKKGQDLESDTSLTPCLIASFSNAKYHKTFSYKALNKSLAFYLTHKGESIPLKDLINMNSWESVEEDDSIIDKHVEDILKENDKKVQKYLNGKKAELKGIIHKVRKKYKDNENIDIIIERVQRKLNQIKK